MAQKLLSKLRNNSDNDKILASLSFVLFMPILFDFITGIKKGSTSIITMIIYAVSFVVILVIARKRIKLLNILLVLLIYTICFLNILLFPESKQFFDTAQYLVLFYYMPIGFIVFRTISSWDNFFTILFVFTPFAIIMGIYILLYTNIANSDDAISYMEFSYALLPFVCASFAYFNIKKHIVGLLLFLIGLIEMLSFGCRGAVLSAIVFAVLLAAINAKRNKWAFILLSILITAIALNIGAIIDYLSGISYFDDSYVLNRAIHESIFDVSSREIIYDNCERRLSSMGMEISGLFGDRPFCGSVYPHNIVYEILMQWGWILGVFILFYLACLFIKGFVYNSTSRFVTLFFICAILLRFFVSGSYLSFGLFWIMIACVQSLKNTKSVQH